MHIKDNLVASISNDITKRLMEVDKVDEILIDRKSIVKSRQYTLYK